MTIKHLRQQCIESLTTLVTNLSTTSTRVFRSRVYPLETAELPGLIVRFRYGNSTERSEALSTGVPRTLQRDCGIEVLGYAQDNGDLDADLNQIALEVEKALAMPVAGPWQSLMLDGTGLDLAGAGVKPVGRVLLSYIATYFTRENTPETSG